MKRIFLSFIFILSLSSANIFSQIEEDWQGYKVSVPFIRIIEFKAIYGPTGIATQGYPPKIITKIIGYEFLLDITISIHGQYDEFNKTVPVIFHTPDGKKTIYNFNQNKAPLRTNQLYTFTFSLSTKYKGYTEVGLLRKFSDSMELTEVYENGLILE